MDWTDWTQWLLVEEDLQPSYVDTLRRRIDYLTQAGVDWREWCRGPGQAKAAVRGHLAQLKRSGKVSMLRACQKALNKAAKYHARTDPAFLGLEWTLALEPKRRLQPCRPEEIWAALDAARPSFKGLRQRCLVYLLANTSPRKGELHALRAEDLDVELGCVWVRHALKDGIPGARLLPRAAFQPGGPVTDYLTARARLAPATGSLWVTMFGRPMSKAALAGDLFDLRARSGAKVNFNRFRHTKNTIWAELGVALQVQQQQNGHGEPKSTMWYTHLSVQGQRNELIRRRVPGYEAESVVDLIPSRWEGLGGVAGRRATGPAAWSTDPVATRSRDVSAGAPADASAVRGPAVGPLQPDGLAKTVCNPIQAGAHAPEGYKENNQREDREGKKQGATRKQASEEVRAGHGVAIPAVVEGRSASLASPEA